MWMLSWGSRRLLKSSYLAPVSKHLDKTQVECIENHPDIHASQMHIPAPVWAQPQEPSCPASSLGFSNLAWLLLRRPV